VRDNAVIGSVEVRIPVLRDLLGADVLELAPFFDIGHGWNEKSTPGRRTIDSIGIGLRYAFADRLQVQAYWGHAFKDTINRGSNIQDDGVYLEFTLRAF
jgi:hemolysin activation/secretion protein